MKFVYPWMLVLVAFVPVAGAVWVFLRARAERRLAAFVAPGLQARLLPRHPRLFGLQAALLLAGLALILFATARPQWGQSEEKVPVRSRNVVIALDVSRSMLAEDVQPNRLERAKSDLAELIDSLDGDRCALVAFRKTGVVLCPLTTDYAFLRSAIEGASIYSAGQGETDIGEAIRKSLDLLKDAKDEHGAIVLISDGGDLRKDYLAPAREAKRRSVPIFTVGLGDEVNESTVPDGSTSGVQTYQGKVVKTRLEEDTLAEIARESGGRYVPLATAGMAETTLGTIYRKYLRQVAEADLAEEEVTRAAERFGWFLVPGILLVLMAALFSRGRFAGRVARDVRRAALLAALFGGFCSAATNAPPAAAVGEPQTANGKPAEHMQGSSLDNREVWNAGVDSYRKGDYTNALATLRPLMRTRTHGARASEIVGAIRHADATNALAQAEAAQREQGDGAAIEPMQRALAARMESARAMQRALRASPDDPRVNRNFARVMSGLEKLRDDLHERKVWVETEGRDAKALVTQSAREALALLEEQADVLTNEAHVALARSESLAKRAEILADAFIPLRRKMPQALTNEEERVELVADLKAAHERTRRAADELADLSPDAGESLSTVENELHDYWKRLLDPQEAFEEAMRAQSNVVMHAERVNGRDWRQEALDFTRKFGDKLPERLLEKCRRDTPASSNEPPYTVRLVQEIDGKVREVVARQESLLKEPRDEEAKRAHAGLVRVRDRCELLGADIFRLMDEDRLMQTNAYADVARTDGYDWQEEALDRTRVFRARFPTWAKGYELQAMGNTNMPPFTKEQQAEVAALAAAVEKIQSECVKEPVPPDQLDALRKIERIRELLPHKQDQQPQNQSEDKSKDESQDRKQDPNKDQDRNQAPNKDPDGEKDQDKDQGPEKDKDQGKEQDGKQEQDQKQKVQVVPLSQEDVEELIRKARERSNEHKMEMEKLKNERQPRRNVRDW